MPKHDDDDDPSSRLRRPLGDLLDAGASLTAVYPISVTMVSEEYTAPDGSLWRYLRHTSMPVVPTQTARATWESLALVHCDPVDEALGLARSPEGYVVVAACEGDEAPAWAVLGCESGAVVAHADTLEEADRAAQAWNSEYLEACA